MAPQRGRWGPHVQRGHLARASCPAHCAPNRPREAAEALLWLGTHHSGCPWARRVKQEAPRCHGCASAPMPAADRPDLSPPAASASQQAPVGQAKLAAAPPQNASKKPAASQPASHISLALANARTPCQLSTGCRRRTKPAQSPISRNLTYLNKINK